jgi:hypothetical protein
MQITMRLTLLLALGCILAMGSSSYAETATVSGGFHTKKEFPFDTYRLKCTSPTTVCARAFDAGPNGDEVFGLVVACKAPFPDIFDIALATKPGGKSKLACVSDCWTAEISIFCDPYSSLCEDGYEGKIRCEDSTIRSLQQPKDN